MDGNFSTEHLGRIIKALRGERWMTQKELAERLSVTPSTVSKWENGVVAPDVFMLRDMAEVFEVSLSDLTGKERTEAGREEEAETDTPPENCAEIHSSPETAPKKTKKIYILLIIGILLGALAGVVLTWYFSVYRKTLQAWVVDEYLTESDELPEYESVYVVALEYRGDLGMEIVNDYTREHFWDQYKERLAEADALVFTYWKKYDPDGILFSSDAVAVLLPENENTDGLPVAYQQIRGEDIIGE